MKCHLCGSNKIKNLGYVGRKPVSITSEPNLCSVPTKIYYCQNCHHLQKLYSDREISLIEKLYKNYDTYNVSSGNEQLVFAENGAVKPRSYYAIDRCVSWLPKSGNLLDVGTGNGAVLKSASSLLPHWKLFGFDLSDALKDEILEIKGVVDFYSGDIQNLPDIKFDLIILWQSLEHILEPANFLAKLSKYLSENGLLLIQIPDIHRTPFDLAVIDHCSHFTQSVFTNLCLSKGLSVAIDGYNWVHNCITLLLKQETNPHLETVLESERFEPDNYFQWLNKTINFFEGSINNRSYAIFGTGISGLWVSSQLSKPPIFFIDEDSYRIGNQIGDVPIISPQDVPPGIDIIMPFINDTGENLAIKIKNLYPSCNSANIILSPPYL